MREKVGGRLVQYLYVFETTAYVTSVSGEPTWPSVQPNSDARRESGREANNEPKRSQKIVYRS